MNDSRKYKILIIEPSPMVRAGLISLLGQNKSFAVISALSDLTYFSQDNCQHFDMILINPSVVDYGKRDNVRAILCISSDMPLFAISYMPCDEEVMNQYDGCINIYDTQERIINKLKKAQVSVRHTDSDENKTLSSRERVILAAVAKGKTNKEIADEFHISVYTVITHRKNISHKLGINTISGLTVYAVLNKLIDTADFY